MEIEAIGDPALLLPMLYAPDHEKKHIYGIIPHWNDHEYCLNRYPDIHIIDPLQPVKDFIEDVVSCEQVISSGLHGLIVADTFGIPNAWIKFNKTETNDFKYSDYYTTTVTGLQQPLSETDFNSFLVH